MNGSRARVMFAAPASGSGKTILTCGVLKLLTEHGIDCTAFKCGPDYIDALFHQEVLGVSGANLDSYFLTPLQLQDHFLSYSRPDQIAVLEGVMGYYDGVGGISTDGSSYEISVITKTPVILVVDGKGSSLSLAALIKGFLEYRSDHQIKGVILNRVNAMMAARLKPLIEELGVKLVGFLPSCEAAQLASRHLGLQTPAELITLKGQMTDLAKQLEKTLDLELLQMIASEAVALPLPKPRLESKVSPRVRIGLARDQAFCFYYQENLRILEHLGAELVTFSPLHDRELPPNLSGVLLGGGYPELYAQELSANQSMRQALLGALKGGLPMVAECGGFLYLHRELEGMDGNCYPMVGAIDAKGYRTDHLARFGYVSLTSAQSNEWLPFPQQVKGHEFHYWDSTDPGKHFYAAKPKSNRGWHCLHQNQHLLAGFAHLYYPSNPQVAAHFVRLCEQYHNFDKADE